MQSRMINWANLRILDKDKLIEDLILYMVLKMLQVMTLGTQQDACTENHKPTKLHPTTISANQPSQIAVTSSETKTISTEASVYQQ